MSAPIASITQMPSELLDMQLRPLCGTDDVAILTGRSFLRYNIDPSTISSLMLVSPDVKDHTERILRYHDGLVLVKYRGRTDLSPAVVIPTMPLRWTATCKLGVVVAVCDISTVRRGSRLGDARNAHFASIVTSTKSLVTYLKWLHSRHLVQRDIGNKLLRFGTGCTVRLKLTERSPTHAALVKAAIEFQQDLQDLGRVTIAQKYSGNAFASVERPKMNWLSAVHHSLVTRMARLMAILSFGKVVSHRFDDPPQELKAIIWDIGLLASGSKVFEDPATESSDVQDLRNILLTATLNLTRLWRHRMMRTADAPWQLALKGLLPGPCEAVHCVCNIALAAGCDLSTTSAPRELGVPVLLWLQLRHVQVLIHTASAFGHTRFQSLLSDLQSIRLQLADLQDGQLVEQKVLQRDQATRRRLLVMVEHDIQMAVDNMMLLRVTGEGVPGFRMLHGTSLTLHDGIVAEVSGRVHGIASAVSTVSATEGLFMLP